jgi:hypothetical protein
MHILLNPFMLGGVFGLIWSLIPIAVLGYQGLASLGCMLVSGMLTGMLVTSILFNFLKGSNGRVSIIFIGGVTYPLAIFVFFLLSQSLGEFLGIVRSDSASAIELAFSYTIYGVFSPLFLLVMPCILNCFILYYLRPRANA